jgi:hypothetical protein
MAHPSQKEPTAAREKGSVRPWSRASKSPIGFKGKAAISGGTQSGVYTENGLLNEIR